MAFASRCGLDIQLQDLPGKLLEKLFCEELGAVIQVKQKDAKLILKQFNSAYVVGSPTKAQTIVIKNGSAVAYQNTRPQLEKWWADTSYRIQSLRDNSQCAKDEFANIGDDQDPGLFSSFKFELSPARYKQ